MSDDRPGDDRPGDYRSPPPLPNRPEHNGPMGGFVALSGILIPGWIWAGVSAMRDIVRLERANRLSAQVEKITVAVAMLTAIIYLDWNIIAAFRQRTLLPQFVRIGVIGCLLSHILLPIGICLFVSASLSGWK